METIQKSKSFTQLIIDIPIGGSTDFAVENEKSIRVLLSSKQEGRKTVKNLYPDRVFEANVTLKDNIEGEDLFVLRVTRIS